MRPSGLSRWLFRRLFRWISGADHPGSLHAPDAPNLLRQLSWIDDEVPPRRRRERRHQAHQEWYCAKRYLLALSTSTQLRFPLTVQKGESPDFLLYGPEGAVTGLEITEATTEAHQRALTATEGDGALHPIGPADGWAGDEPEQGLADLVARSVRTKVAKMQNSATWQGADRHDLLIYNNGPYVLTDPLPLLARFEAHLGPVVAALNAGPWPHGPLGRISVLTGNRLLYDVLGQAQVLNLPEHAG